MKEDGACGLSLNMRGVLFLSCITCIFSLIVLATRYINFLNCSEKLSYHVQPPFCADICLRHLYLMITGIVVLLCVATLLVGLLGRLSIFERVKIWRKEDINEVLLQIAYFSAAIAILTAVFWGVLGAERRFHVAIGLVAWGFGDTAAAIVGKTYGKRKYKSVIFDPNKTIEGTFGMIVTSFVFVLICMFVLFDVSILESIMSSLLLAVVSGFVEAVSRKGLDTLAVPFAVAALSPLVMMLASSIVH